MSSSTTSDSTASQSELPGEEAEKPQQIPARGWLQIVKRGWKESNEDQVSLMAAGCAYYGFMAIFPGIVALVLIYGLAVDPATITSQVNSLAKTLPSAARDLIVNQIQNVATVHRGGAILSLIVAVLLGLWSASGGVNNLMGAINTAYDEEKKRNFLKQRGLALLLTAGAIVLMVLMLLLVVVLPPLLEKFLGGGVLRWVVEVGRWLVAIVLVTAALAVLYRVAPDRDAPKMRWVSIGAAVATVLWILASIGFSLYASRGGYTKTYGAVASVVVLLLWLYITAYAILLGAEINAESEQQTVKDTTKGPPQPLGSRDAVKADSVPTDDAAQKGSTSSRDRGARSGEGDAGRQSGEEEGESSTATARSVAAGTAGGSAVTARVSEPSSLAGLLRQVSDDTTRLARDEVRLAQAELTQKGKRLGGGLGLFGGTALVALFGMGALVAVGVAVLALALPGWLAALIVGIVVLGLAGAAALVGRRQVSAAGPLKPTRALAEASGTVRRIKDGTA